MVNKRDHGIVIHNSNKSLLINPHIMKLPKVLTSTILLYGLNQNHELNRVDQIQNYNAENSKS